MTDLEPAAAIAAIKAILGITSSPVPPPVIDDWGDLLHRAQDFNAVQKIEIVKAMGFRPGGSDHQWDCGYQFDPGIRCNCVPPATTWSQPADVDVYLGETWEERRNDKRDRSIPAVER